MDTRRIRRFSRGVGVCIAAIFVAIVLVPVGAFAQMQTPAASAKTFSAPEPIKSDVSASLPKQGNVTVNFKDVEIQTVLRYLSEVSGVDIVPSPGVEGTVTMRLRDKPWEVALDIVTRNYNYAYSRDDEKGIIRVMPKSSLQEEEPVTVVIPLNYIIQNTEDIMSLSSDDDEVGTDRNISQLMKAVNSVISPKIGERATFLPNVNSIVVTAIPARVGIIKEMLAKIDKKTPQIMLDAKVIEVTLDKDDQFGIDWNAVVSATGASRPTTLPFRNDGSLNFLPSKQTNYYPATTLNSTGLSGKGNMPIVDAFSAVGQMINPTTFTTATNTANLFSFGTLDFSQFSATLRMINNRDDTTILSSPHITTLNNQPAVIKVVTNIYLQKQQKTTEDASVVTVEFEEDPREVGVILNVTPHINEKDEIIVNLRPQVSSSLTFEELSVSGSTNTVAMAFDLREADTQVLVKDGETIFIGGLISETKAKEDHKVPFLGDLLGDVPIVGGLVKYKQDNVNKSEVVFFVTVHIIKDGEESIIDSETQEKYEQYYGKSVRGKNENEVVINKGELKISKKTAEVSVNPKKKKEEDKERKPLMDFRKGKTEKEKCDG
ncbi:MAG: hypothetical protein ISS33_00700 [Candidatus Omnitrophica bacterium]|nr:hypothetical protein [Candidatus Omnitrophota bacterium]